MNTLPPRRDGVENRNKVYSVRNVTKVSSVELRGLGRILN